MTVLENIGVLGAGAIGDGVAERIATEGYKVVLVDTKPEFIERAMTNIKERLRERAASGTSIFPEEPEAILARISATTDSNALVDLPFIIECIPEDKEIKHDTLRRISQICRKETVFATSITTCTVSELADGLSFADRLVGMHFCSNPSQNRLVELVRTEKSGKRSVHILEQVAHRIGGVPIWSEDVPGFIVKRLSAAFFSEAVRVLNEGVANIPTIEAAVKAAFSIEAGPFGLMNNEGLGIAEFASEGLAAHLPSVYTPPERLRAQSASNEQWDLTGDVDNEKLDTVKERFIGLAILVGAAIADENVASPVDIDLGAKYGLGWSNGPFEMINNLSVEKALALAKQVAEVRALAIPNNLESLSAKDATAWPLEYVDLAVDEDKAQILIKRPDKDNVLDDTTVSQLEGALKKAEKNDAVKIIVFSGLGGVLASGPSREFLVEKMQQNDIDGILAHYRKIHRLLSKIADSKKVTIARARGLTMGGGVELGLACKYLIASARSFFTFPETGQGIHPGLGATQRLPRKAGKSIGKYVIMTGEILAAESAERLGIVDAVMDDDDAFGLLVNNLGNSETLSDEEAVPSDDELQAISLFNPTNCPATLVGNITQKTPAAKRVKEILAAKAPVALTLVNKLIDDGLGLEISKALNVEISALGLILGTKDALAGLSAKATPPAFSGE